VSRQALRAFVRRVVDRLLLLEVIDRSLVVGAQAFSALVPLLIVIASIGSRDGRSFAEALIARFDLEGEGADAVRSAFAAPADGDTVTVIGGLLVIVSALAFTRALQRTYELTWNLDRRGMRGTAWGLLWLAVISLSGWVSLVVDGALDNGLGLLVSLAVTCTLWLVTPYVLLARRIAWRRLVPQAGLTAAGMTILGLGSALYAPRAMSSSASQFGAMGVAFTLLSLLWAAGFVLVSGAAIGAALVLPTWSPTSPGSVTPRSSSGSAAPGS
jgi:membrane protein